MSDSNMAEAKVEDDIYTKDGTVDYKNRPANKTTTGTWKACPYILGNECCERLAYYGMSTNLGMTQLTLSALVPVLKPTCVTKDDCHATEFQSAICFTALYLVADFPIADSLKEALVYLN